MKENDRPPPTRSMKQASPGRYWRCAMNMSRRETMRLSATTLAGLSLGGAILSIGAQTGPRIGIQEGPHLSTL